MAERDRFDRLDRMIDAIVAGEAAPALEPELAMLAVIASDLRHLPDPQFKARLARELFPGRKEQSMHVRPYLIVPGADDLIAFLQQTFDAEVAARYPTSEGKVMHAEVRVGDSVLEMGDAGEQWQPIAAPLHVYLENVDEAYRRAIAAGATSLFEPVDQPYGDREAGVRDARGIEWFLATRLEGGPRPEGFGTVTTGFRAAGAAQLLEFLRNAFGAVHVSGSMEHAEVRLGETMIELSEAKEAWPATRGAFHLFVPDCDAVYADALRAGATSLWAPEDKPYGERSAGVTDAWGNQWYIATPLAS
ncbi:MAG TPA: VOC family protein [Thermoanaerobaculia bacterium]